MPTMSSMSALNACTSPLPFRLECTRIPCAMSALTWSHPLLGRAIAKSCTLTLTPHPTCPFRPLSVAIHPSLRRPHLLSTTESAPVLFHPFFFPPCSPASRHHTTPWKRRQTMLTCSCPTCLIHPSCARVCEYHPTVWPLRRTRSYLFIPRFEFSLFSTSY